MFHGLALDVPASWFAGSVECGVPKTDVIETPVDFVATCATRRPPGITSVEWLRWDSQGGLGYQPPLTNPHTSTLTIDGHRATRTDGVTDDLHVTRLVVPDLFAGVEIDTPEATSADRILDTLRVVASSPEGCAASTSIVTVADVPRPTREGAADHLIPDVPSAIVICRYADGHLEQSGVLADGGRPVARMINALPGGLSIARPGSYLPSVCDLTTTRSDTLDAVNESYLLLVSYDSGPPLTLAARLGFCGDLGISNGARNGQRTSALDKALVQAAGISGGLPFVVAKS